MTEPTPLPRIPDVVSAEDAIKAATAVLRRARSSPPRITIPERLTPRHDRNLWQAIRHFAASLKPIEPEWTAYLRHIKHRELAIGRNYVDALFDDLYAELGLERATTNPTHEENRHG